MERLGQNRGKMVMEKMYRDPEKLMKLTERDDPAS